jgi:exosortase
MTSVGARGRNKYWVAAACAFPGIVIFQFFGNSTHGYIDSSSLFYWWGFQWFNPQSETQHGLPILLISIWLLVRALRRGDGAPRMWTDTAAAATAAMIFGLLLHVVGFVAEQARVSITGLLLFSWGCLALGGGPRWARAAAFPVAFLVFAIPLNALDTIGFWLRLWVVGTSGSILHVFGVHVLINGTQLLSPDGSYDYDVAAACSGVRSLVALCALSVLIGYLWFRVRLMWLILCAASLPLIYVGNVVRIVSIVAAAHWGGPAKGDLAHQVMGFAVFAIVLAGVIGLAEAVARLMPSWVSTPVPLSKSSSVPSSGTDDTPQSIRGGAACVFAASLICLGVLMHVAREAPTGRAGIELTQDGLNPVPLPAFLGSEWMAQSVAVSQIERQVLPSDTGFSRTIYVSLSDPSRRVFLSIVLSGRDRTSIHRPEYCLVGQGWTIGSSFEHAFKYPGEPATIGTTVLRVTKDVLTPKGTVHVQQLFSYYFVGADGTLATHWQRIAKDSWERVAHGRSDRWAYVVLQTDAADGEDAALGRMQTILDGALPAFQKRT